MFQLNLIFKAKQWYNFPIFVLDFKKEKEEDYQLGVALIVFFVQSII